MVAHSNASTSAAETMAARKRQDVGVSSSTEIEVYRAVSRSSGSPTRPTSIRPERRQRTDESYDCVDLRLLPMISGRSSYRYYGAATAVGEGEDM